jgi:NRPS condensation-like uncharacterized protein
MSNSVGAFVFPVSFEQQRLWFLDQLAPGSTAYNVPAGFRIKGVLQVEALEKSLRCMVERHEILRTTFATVNDLPMQVVHETLPFDFVSEDLSAVEPFEHQDRIQAVIDKELVEPFDLARGPLVRGRLLRFAPDDHFLLMSIHHIITDGWSVGVFFGELAALYSQIVSSQEPSLPPLEIQYADYAVWQRDETQTEAMEQHLDYWRNQLSGTQSTTIPSDYAGSAAPDAPVSVLDFRIGRDRAARLEEVTRRNGATTFITLLSALKVVLRYFTNHQDLVVGTDIANRVLVETEPLIGFFANQLVLRTKLAGSHTFADVIQRVRRTTLEAYEHQAVPFDRLVEELRPDRAVGSSSPFFQVKFVLQNAPQGAPSLGDVVFEPVDLGSRTAKFEILINVRHEGDDLCGSLHYRTDLFSTSTAERIIGLFQQVLELVAENAGMSLADINQSLRHSDHERAQSREKMFQESSRRSLSTARRVRVTERVTEMV